jgi:hypothetical protein
MVNVCEECNAVNTDGATVCRTCGCSLFLDSESPAAPSRRPAVMVPAGNRTLIAWLVGGVAAIAMLALAAFIIDLMSSPPQRMQFGPDAPPFPRVLPAPVTAPAPQPTSTDEPAVAASAASAVAAPPLRSHSLATPKAPAGKSSIKTPASGGTIPAGADPDPAAANPPTPEPAVPLPASTETETKPSEICGDKSFLAFAVCLADKCNTPALFGHPACVRIREQDNKRREREELGG